MAFPQARQSFDREINQPDKQIDLAKAALYIAQEEYPNLDPDEYLNALDTMAAELQERLPDRSYPLRVIQTINRYLYDDLEFTGNVNDYYDPRNSFLNEVLDRRVGIPITLALIYLEVAKRIDFPMVGIGMPGHFLIRPNFPEMETFVDPFNRGEVIFAQDCQEKLTQIFGQPMEMRSEFLESVSNRQFLVRMLMNLKVIYLRQEELEKALAAVERILLLLPELPGELRDRGLIHYQLGQWVAAIADLEDYLNQAPNAEDAPAIRRLLKQLGRN